MEIARINKNINDTLIAIWREEYLIKKCKTILSIVNQINNSKLSDKKKLFLLKELQALTPTKTDKQEDYKR